MIIYKYVIEPKDKYFLKLPNNSQILSAQNQREKLCVWVRIENPRETEERTHTIRVIMTGDENTSNIANLRFIDTVQFAQGAFVVHVFEQL